MKRLLLHIILLLIPVAAWAQPAVSVTSEADRMLIGDQIILHLKAVVEEGDIVEWPGIPEELESALVVDRNDVDTSRNKGQLILTENWIITSFDSGFAVIPPLVFKINGYERASDPLLIQVDMPKSEAEYKDIIDPVGLPIPFWRIAIALFIFLALAIFVWLFIRHGKKNRPSLDDLVDPRPLHIQHAEKAVKLSGLQTEDLDEKLSKGLQNIDLYLRNGLGINTAVGESSDWTKKLKGHPRYAGNADELPKLFERVNALRFGGQDLDAQSAEDWLLDSQKWITESVEGADEAPHEESKSINDLAE